MGLALVWPTSLVLGNRMDARPIPTEWRLEELLILKLYPVYHVLRDAGARKRGVPIVSMIGVIAFAYGLFGLSMRFSALYALLETSLLIEKDFVSLISYCSAYAI
jgi:hypothetical protein